MGNTLNDNVKNPSHYKMENGIECIDAIKYQKSHGGPRPKMSNGKKEMKKKMMDKKNDIHTALHRQVGGNHYSKMAITPLEYIHANNLDFCQGNVVKYISRHKDKNKDEDVKKCIDYCIKILCLDYGYTSEKIHELLKKLE